MKITCEHCLYWDNRHEEERAQGRSGFCRHDTPHPEWTWALTDPDDWCGQATPRESGSTQPVHEAAQAVTEAWSSWLLKRGPATLPNGLGAFDAVIGDLEKALERMKP